MDCKKVSDEIVRWLKDYADNAGSKGFVIGISGGIDSAVTSTLCAMTGLPVLCLEMPIHQHEEHISRAKEHIDFLHSKFEKIDNLSVNLSDSFDILSTSLPFSAGNLINDDVHFARANVRARLRMTALYYYAGLSQSLVAGTGNKVEDFGIGFFTKYGDGGVDLSPIGDLLKSEVYELASYLGVPASIQQAVPTDGLFGDTRSDEDQIGATYNELEWAMGWFTELNNGEEHIDLSEREKLVTTIYFDRHAANAHKMAMPPVCSLKGKKY